jgi:hypothetical protein
LLRVVLKYESFVRKFSCIADRMRPVLDHARI